MLLDKKTAIITGSGKGIGCATAWAFARQGANVVIADIDEAAAKKTAEEIAAHVGCSTLALCADVSDDAQVREIVEKTVREFGALHIVVNNAGICPLANKNGLLEIPMERWDKTFDINLKGPLFFSRAARPHMISAGYGRIINFASQAARNGGLRVSPEYSTSKAAVMCLTKTLAMELGKDGITVNTVAPGLIKTEMTSQMKITDDMVPLGRLGTPDDVADTVVFLASDLARYVTGVCLDVNGGTVMA